jgi:transcriptional regulator
MYVPKAFEESDLNKLHNLILNNNFGILFNQTEDGPFATHLPFMIDAARGEFGTLIAHFAKANSHWQLFDSSQEVLVVFQGPHSYISPSWYENKVTVPTWNYAVTHVYGIPEITHDKEKKRAMVAQLVHYHEADRENPWDIESAEPVMDAELDHIVGFEIPISRIEGKYKFNQNRTLADQTGVAEALQDSVHENESQVASIMNENIQVKKKRIRE